MSIRKDPWVSVEIHPIVIGEDYAEVARDLCGRCKKPKREIQGDYEEQILWLEIMRIETSFGRSV